MFMGLLSKGRIGEEGEAGGDRGEASEGSEGGILGRGSGRRRLREDTGSMAPDVVQKSPVPWVEETGQACELMWHKIGVSTFPGVNKHASKWQVRSLGGLIVGSFTDVEEAAIVQRAWEVVCGNVPQPKDAALPPSVETWLATCPFHVADSMREAGEWWDWRNWPKYVKKYQIDIPD